MAKQTINLGTQPNGADGDTIRTAFEKSKANFDELYQQVGAAKATADAAMPKAGGAFAGAVSFRVRPSFNGAAPWDSNNFNPANHALLAGAVFTGQVTTTQLSLSAPGAGSGQLIYPNPGTNNVNIRTIGTAGGKFFSFQDDGNAVAGNGNWINASDKRIKSDVQTISGALALVRQMRGVWYRRINEDAKSTLGRLEAGVIAQELQGVADELVHEIGMSPDRSAGPTLGVAYGNLSAYLIEAIKALANQVEALEAKVDAIGGKGAP